ncbi:MAG TPA: hypothetical protein VHB46_15960 [Burkholderiales bacterium]|nr:hypothetical protein [Burkholderiales bacterium]
MSRRKVVDRGDMIAIPTTDGREVFAQVCWASTYYKDVLQLAFVANPTEAALKGQLTFLGPTIFSGASVVRQKRWRKLFTHHQLYEPSPPIFYSGGAIHRGDEYLREATGDDQTALLKLSVLGAALVEKKATEIANRIHGDA